MSRKHGGHSTGDGSIDAPRLPRSLFETARLQRDRRKSDRDEADRRSSDRAEVNARASLGISLRHGVEGHLHNLSAEGCSLRLTSGLFKAGEEVWFRIDSIQPWKGTVRWVNGDNVGVEFERPFHRSVFDLLVQSNKPVTVSHAA